MIAGLKDQFTSIVACIHPTCWRRGYWVDAFRKRDIPVIQGVYSADGNAFYRMQMLLSSFDFMTTNGFGSHLAYAAYFGAKPSLFGTYPIAHKANYTNDGLYQSCPALLEPTLKAISEESIRQHFPFLFCEPHNAQDLQKWGAEEVGESCRVAPKELRDLFDWKQPAAARRRARHLSGRVANKARLTTTFLTQLPVKGISIASRFEFRALRNLPAQTPASTRILGKQFEFTDVATFLASYDKIMRKQIYRFATGDPEPTIIDGGANIGLSVLYLKNLYPKARLVAFEPDPSIFRVLQRNCQKYELKNVELFQEALWTENTTLNFRFQGTLGGRLATTAEQNAAEGARNEEYHATPTRRLRDVLQESARIALLKLDIEGAETEILEDCAGALGNVDHLFVEYHSFVDRPQSLHRLLAVVYDAGFRVHLHVHDPSPQPLFLRKIREDMNLADLNVDVFCYRSE